MWPNNNIKNDLTANIGIAASGAGHLNFGCLHRCTFVLADEYLCGFCC